MTTDMVMLERAVMVMAVCMAVQTLLMIGAAVGAFLAYRSATVAIDEKMLELQGHVNYLKAHVDRIVVTLDEAVSAVKRGTEAVGEVVDDARGALGSVRNGVASIASVATAPRTAAAVAVLRGIQWWRRHRAAERVEAVESGIS